MTGSAPLDLLLIALPAAAALFWWNSRRAHELALGHAKRACQQRQLQLLDQNVALNRIRATRHTSGGICLIREYSFEFTDEGVHRDAGQVTMLGHTLNRVYFPYIRDDLGHRLYSH